MITSKVSTTFILILIAMVLGISFYVEYSKQHEEEPSPINTEDVEATEMVKLYYYNPALDSDNEGSILCSEKGLVPVYRFLPKSSSILEETLQLLLKGELTDAEKATGLSTEYPLPGFTLKNTRLTDGMLTLAFEDPENKSSGGSCRVEVLWLQIEMTAKQFPEIKEVRFEPEWIFQP